MFQSMAHKPIQPTLQRIPRIRHTKRESHLQEYTPRPERTRCHPERPPMRHTRNSPRNVQHAICAWRVESHAQNFPTNVFDENRHDNSASQPLQVLVEVPNPSSLLLFSVMFIGNLGGDVVGVPMGVVNDFRDC
jgi:hypothetical protein